LGISAFHLVCEQLLLVPWGRLICALEARAELVVILKLKRIAIDGTLRSEDETKAERQAMSAT